MNHPKSGLSWRKSTYSAQGDCVEIAQNGDLIAVRDSKNPDGPVLTFPRGTCLAFLVSVNNNKFNRA